MWVYIHASDTFGKPINYGVAGLDIIQTALAKDLSSLEIKPHEFLTDDLSRSPYKLMPDYNNSDETDGEGNTIEIYYKNN